MSVEVNGDAVKMVALLNYALRVEINREASFYLSALHGIIDGGKNVLPGMINLFVLVYSFLKLRHISPHCAEKSDKNSIFS
jgi:hypothetical protein